MLIIFCSDIYSFPSFFFSFFDKLLLAYRLIIIFRRQNGWLKQKEGMKKKLSY